MSEANQTAVRLTNDLTEGNHDDVDDDQTTAEVSGRQLCQDKRAYARCDTDTKTEKSSSSGHCGNIVCNSLYDSSDNEEDIGGP